MTTKNMFTAILVIVMSCSISFSQKHHKKFDPQARLDRQLTKMDEVVKFTGNQRNDVQALFTLSMQKKKDAFCANDLGSDGMKDAMKTIRKETEDGLAKILSADQLKLWKNHRKEHKKEHGDKKQKHKDLGERIDSRLNKMDTVVKFTGTQRDQLKQLFIDLAKRSKNAFCDNEPGSDGFKDAMKKIKEDKEAGMEKILTKDQMDLWKAHKKSDKKHHKKLNQDSSPVEK